MTVAVLPAIRHGRRIDVAHGHSRRHWTSKHNAADCAVASVRHCGVRDTAARQRICDADVGSRAIHSQTLDGTRIHRSIRLTLDVLECVVDCHRLTTRIWKATEQLQSQRIGVKRGRHVAVLTHTRTHKTDNKTSAAAAVAVVVVCISHDHRRRLHT